MPMSTSDVPDGTARGSKTPPANVASTSAGSPPADSSLLPAAESTDPAVHQLLAERASAELNEDSDAGDDVTRRLAQLGYR
jgi:hypothetical protein